MQREFLERCAGSTDALVGDGAFSPGPALWVGTREVAHSDADGSLDVRLTKEVIRSRRDELESDDRVTLRGRSSDWVAVTIVDAAGAEHAYGLVQDAVIANLPSARPGAPPTAEALARRRRFH